MDVRRLHAGEESAAVQLADKVFRDGEQKSMGAAFPTLFSPEVIGHSYGCFIDNQLVSFMGLAPATIRVGRAKLPVYSLGAVCTDPDYQGNGYASHILKAILDDIQKTPAPLLFVSGGRSLYTRVGCRTFGKAFNLEIERSVEETGEIKIREMSATDILGMTQLASKREVAFEQTAHDIALLIDAEAYASCVKRKHKVLVAEKEGQIVSYFIVSLSYLEGGHHEALGIEWAGDSAGIRTIVSSCFDLYGVNKVRLYVPWQEAELISQFPKAVSYVEENQGTILVTQLDQLLEQLKLYFDDLGKKVDCSASVDMDELVSFLFNPDNDKGLAIPLPYMVGLNYI